MFRDRPLTWLFVIANASVDFVLVSQIKAGNESMEMPIWSLLLSLAIPAQLLLASCWICLSECERLSKGAMLTLSVFIAIMMNRYALPWSGDGLALAYAAAAPSVFLGFLFVHGLGGKIRSRKEEALKEIETFQFSLMELFGWTCIVAIWSAGFKYYQDSFQEFEEGWTMILSLSVLSVLTLSLLRWQIGWHIRLSLLAFVLLTLVTITISIDSKLRQEDYWGYAGWFFVFQLYLIAGHVVRVLDDPASRDRNLSTIRSTLPQE